MSLNQKAKKAVELLTFVFIKIICDTSAKEILRSNKYQNSPVLCNHSSKTKTSFFMLSPQVIQGEVDEVGFCAAAFMEENEKKNRNQHVIPCEFKAPMTKFPMIRFVKGFIFRKDLKTQKIIAFPTSPLENFIGFQCFFVFIIAFRKIL